MDAVGITHGHVVLQRRFRFYPDTVVMVLGVSSRSQSPRLQSDENRSDEFSKGSCVDWIESVLRAVSRNGI